jgi:hypothetical protein
MHENRKGTGNIPVPLFLRTMHDSLGDLSFSFCLSSGKNGRFNDFLLPETTDALIFVPSKINNKMYTK